MLASSFGCDEGLWQLMIKVHLWENMIVKLCGLWGLFKGIM
jgi:hypothetical protein